MTKTYQFHPLADEYPLMNAHDLGRMEEGMRRWGYDPGFPIILFQNKILDGRNRYLAAKATGVKPIFETFIGDEAKAREFVQMANEERRHLEAKWLSKRREERIARIAAARQGGKSLRTIAEDEGVSLGQVQRDLSEDSSGVSPDTPEPTKTLETRAANGEKQPDVEKTTGRDGKTYPATKPAATNGHASADEAPLCDRCKRVGATAGCKRCAGLQRPSPAAKNGQRHEPGDADEGLDKEKHPVTPVAADAFANLTRFEALDALARQLQKGIHELSLLPGGEQLRRHLRATGNDEKTLNKSEHLESLKRDLKFTRPHAVCPWCKGKGTKGCKGCQGTGWVSKVTWDSADERIKANLA